jgi:colicin import membrane protein
MNAVLNSPPVEPGKRLSLVLTVAVHLLLASFLIYGIRWQTQAPEAVEVELVRALQAVAPPPTPAPEIKPAANPEPKLEPKVEAKPLPQTKPDIAIKEKPKPVKEAPTSKPDAFQEQLRREQEQLTQIKATNAASEELAKVKTAQAEQKAAQLASARNKVVADYLSKIRGKIRGNIILPPDVKGNPEAVFDVTQLPNGEILAVKLKRSSANPTLDAAIERAIFKSNPLPKPDQSDVFSRSLELHFRPLDD